MQQRAWKDARIRSQRDQTGKTQNNIGDVRPADHALRRRRVSHNVTASLLKWNKVFQMQWKIVEERQHSKCRVQIRICTHNQFCCIGSVLQLALAFTSDHATSRIGQPLSSHMVPLQGALVPFDWTHVWHYVMFRRAQSTQRWTSLHRSECYTETQFCALTYMVVVRQLQTCYFLHGLRFQGLPFVAGKIVVRT